MKDLNQLDISKISDDCKSKAEKDYNFLVERGFNHLYDDIKFEQWEYLTWENLHYLSNIVGYIESFKKTKNTGYVDLMLALIEDQGFKITKTIEKVVIEAAILRINETDKGGIRELSRENIKNNALLLMFKLMYFLEFSKTQASERAAYFVYRATGEAKVISTSLCKTYNNFVRESSAVNKIKNYSESDYQKTKNNWLLAKDNYPPPPDGHEVLGK